MNSKEFTIEAKRYRVYREHKYVLQSLAELEQFIAKMDFRAISQLDQLSTKTNGLIGLMQGHAEHEDKTISSVIKR